MVAEVIRRWHSHIMGDLIEGIVHGLVISANACRDRLVDLISSHAGDFVNVVSDRGAIILRDGTGFRDLIDLFTQHRQLNRVEKFI